MAQATMEAFTVREAHINDLPQVIDAARHTWEATYAHMLSPLVIQAVFEKEYSLSHLEHQLRSPTHALFVAASAKGIVGYAGYRRAQHATTADLTHLYVPPAYQRKGIGSRLLTAVAVDLTRRGVTAVRTLVATANSPALQFYQRRGFTRQSDYVTFLENQMVEVTQMYAPLSQLQQGRQSGMDQSISL